MEVRHNQCVNVGVVGDEKDGKRERKMKEMESRREDRLKENEL